MTPTASPKSSAAPTATPTPSGCSFIVSAAAIDSTAPTEMSMPPLISTTVSPRAMIPLKETWRATLATFCSLRKMLGWSTVKTANSTRRMLRTALRARNPSKRSIRVPRYRRLTKLSSPTTARKTTPFTMN